MRHYYDTSIQVVHAGVRIRTHWQMAEELEDQSGAHEGFCACVMSQISHQIRFEPRNPCQLLSDPLGLLRRSEIFIRKLTQGFYLFFFFAFPIGQLLGHLRSIFIRN